MCTVCSSLRCPRVREVRDETESLIARLKTESLSLCVPSAPSLGFGGFKLTEAQYLEKLDSIAAALNDWGQSQFVREFFLEAVKPRRGLPSRPRADTAVTLRLNTSPTWSQVPQEKVDSYWQFL